MDSNKVTLKTRNTEHTYYTSREILNEIKNFIDGKTMLEHKQEMVTPSSTEIPYGSASSLVVENKLKVRYDDMEKSKRELLDIYRKSQEVIQEICVIGETGTYNIILCPNQLPMCTCPSYENQNYSEIRGCCKHIHQLFYTIDIDIYNYNWNSR
jgi:hypothetical protein